jgi:glycosyltransferase involved in cell wall biosynthesis
MRVAILSLHRGGMAHHAAALTRSALAAAPETEVACFVSDDVPPLLFDRRVQRFSFPVPHHLSLDTLAHLLRVPRDVRHLRTAIEAWQPDVLHVNSGHLWQLPIIGRLSQCTAVVATIHDVRAHPGERRWDHAVKRRPLFRHARRILVHSESLRVQAIQAWRVAPARIEVVPLALMETAPGGEAAVAEREGSLLLLGRIYAYKGIDVLLRALPRIAAEIPGAQLVIAGEGNLAPWRNALARNGRRVRILNRFLTEDEIRALMQEASVVALPYVEASQSGVALMAASFGKPVVASRVGAIPEVVVHEETGLLVEPGDAEGLAAAAVDLLRSRDKRQRLGREARRRGQLLFGPKPVGLRLMNVYERVVAERKGGQAL